MRARVGTVPFQLCLVRRQGWRRRGQGAAPIGGEVVQARRRWDPELLPRLQPRTPTQTGLSFDRWPPRRVLGGDVDPSCKGT